MSQLFSGRDTLYLTNFRWHNVIVWAECANPDNRQYPLLYVSESLKVKNEEIAVYKVSEKPRRISGSDFGLDKMIKDWIRCNYLTLVKHWNSELTSCEFLEKIMDMKDE